MRKKACARRLMDSQHGKGPETLIKITQHYFCQTFLTPWKKMFSKNSFLVVSETFRLFVNQLTPDDKYSLSLKASD